MTLEHMRAREVDRMLWTTLLLCVMVVLWVAAYPLFVSAKAVDYQATIDVRPANGNEVDNITGFVFEDLNRDGKFQRRQEPGIAVVMVSDGLHVVLTDAEGKYELPLPTDADEHSTRCGTPVSLPQKWGLKNNL
jgi:hypothetical protein